MKGGKREKKCKEGNKETRGERWGTAVSGSFFSRGIQHVTVPTVNVCAATVCRLCTAIRTMTFKKLHGKEKETIRLISANKAP